MQDERQLLIGGRRCPAEASRTEQDVSPQRDEVFATVAAASPADVERAVDAAAAAFPEWSRTDPLERRAVLERAADLLEQRTEQAVELMVGELGATRGWALFNAGLAANILREAGASAKGPRGEVLPSSSPGEWSFSVRQPVGVVAAFAPWNAPLILGARAFAVPLAVGNAVVLKPSEEAPVSAGLFLADLLHEAGLPDGVLNVVTNARADAVAVGNALIDDRRVRRVNFTGSTEVGRAVGVRAAQNLKPALLELGGKNSIVVLDDADLEHAVDAVAFGAYLNAGQICMSADRILVPEPLRAEFLERFAAKVQALPWGSPDDPSTVVGPLVNRGAAERVGELVEDAVTGGAKLHCGGGAAEGALYRPTVLSGVEPRHRIYAEETFGPVSAVIGYDDVDEAVRVVNDTPFGLTAGVITEDVRRGWSLAQRLETGIVHINDQSVADDPQAPFGGVKESGYGRFGGRHGVEAFTDTRWITFRENQAQYPF